MNYCDLKFRTFIFFLTSLLFACQSSTGNQDSESAQTYTSTFFELVPAAETGVDFSNEVSDGDIFNILTYRNFYNGGGVAIGDINNDGLPDLYFTANQKANQLYLNQGNFQFQDITEKAGVSGSKPWSTGATMADVNGDGWLDIYVSNSGDIEGGNKENELFINQANGTFLEQAAQYGLNNQGYSTQAGFFDYDLDGDLDCYLLNNSFKDPGTIELFKSMRDKPDELGGDKLYRNDGDKFTDVTAQAGIYSSKIGFGLGAAISDINGDHWPDIYISNDFWERDYLYINQQDGTFSEELIDRINLCSVASMGGDIADLNNDGFPEIISTDMLAGDNLRLQAMTVFDPYHLEDQKYRANYHYQMIQNCLHLNDGQGRFQEIAMYAGVGATDWSWAALAFDFENDGHKDIFVSNGISKDIMSMDFRDFLTDNNVYKMVLKRGETDLREFTAQMPSQALPNYAFQNQGQLRFDNQADALGLGQASFSNGSAYADLDNDGDLDLVVNNVNTPAFVYRNQADQRLDNHYLKLSFKGYDKNPFGIGAEVRLKTNGETQSLQNFNSRGFQSCIEPQLLFGLGKASLIDELEVIWPDQKIQKITQVPVDQILMLDHANAEDVVPPTQASPAPMYAEVGAQYLKGRSRHLENRYNDFDHEPLLLAMLSTEGPRIVKGDVNGDQREDFLLPGAHGDEDKLFIQNPDGNFNRRANASFGVAKDFESTCGAFFDNDGDGDLDLMLGAGGNEYQRGSQYFILRYFENDGNGNLNVKNADIPQVVGNFSCLEAGDVNGDGQTDLFIGGRTVPGNYGLPPRSYLFVKNGDQWVDASPDGLAGIGMVTDASWADVDGDQDQDLIVVGDWMAVQVFKNENGRLLAPITIPQSQGWWTRVEPVDLDRDGDLDFVLGNWGLNHKFQASPSRPLSIYTNDFDQNGKTEFIISWYPPLEKQAFPFATKMELSAQLPELKRRILKYEDYARQTYETLFPPEVRSQSFAFQAKYLESAVLWNDGGNFRLQALPMEAQLAPVFGIVADDFTGNGQTDIWLGGNFYSLKPQVGRHDASRGVLLEGQADRKFRYVSPYQSGIYVEGEVRDATLIQVGDKRQILVSRNNDEPLLYEKTLVP